MGKNTTIEWCDHTWNCWEGCSKVSPGCAHCYAEARNHRWGNDNWGKGKPRRRTSAANWKQPLNWNHEAIWKDAPLSMVRPRVFCASIADWLDDEVPIEWFADLLELIHATPNLDWLLLTKRPENFGRQLREAHIWAHNREHAADEFAFDWVVFGVAPSNVWVGVSVENQEMADKRIPELLKIPANVRFLSVEPMIGPVEPIFSGGPNGSRIFFRGPRVGKIVLGIHWVICGAESGPRRRPMSENWARSLKNQCEAAGVAFFMKQMQAGGRITGDIDQFPEDLRVRQFPEMILV